MAKLRYVRSLDQLKRAAEANPEFLESSVRSVRVSYETDPALVAAVTPRPLEPTERPEVCVTFSHVAMHITPEYTFEIGSAIFGVRTRYDGTEGIYLITMPMTTEQAVVPGRETYGEPKKIADIDFSVEGDRVCSKVTRMGVPYLEVQGTLGESLGARKLTDFGFCYKALPSCEQGAGFDSDPLLVQLEWKHTHSDVRKIDNGELILRESPFDPVVDLPVRRIVSMEYEEGSSESNGRVLRSIPGDWLLPFLHGRYDDSSGEGIEVPDR
ncbi:MAG: acetoacetate decarboxylase family protein [bacterium]|nr:acetoacetate decarboxylase family protein [bacterium]MCP5071000.1 acetoacetate decarboxylase family protein [bacterium]